MENISFALLLMAVGMTTVFLVLLIVIFLGKGLVAIVNRWLPAEENNKTAAAPADTVDKRKIAAITTAVDTLFQGRAKITRIEKW